THIAIYWKFILANQPHLKEIWILAWWRLWKGRNRVVFDRAQTRLDTLFRHFHSQWREHNLIYGPPTPSPPPTTRTPLATWLPPHPTRLKINVDGAVRPNVGGSSGWVLRNSYRVVLRAIGTTYSGIVDPFVLELLAFRDACIWCLWAGVLQVDIEGDAELVSTKLLTGQVLANPGGAIVEEILQLQKGAPAWRFMTVRCSGYWTETMARGIGC
ncbi:hypothetical protein LINPERPRIM_LOCUS1371, partial [Linum perenne]